MIIKIQEVLACRSILLGQVATFAVGPSTRSAISKGESRLRTPCSVRSRNGAVDVRNSELSTIAQWLSA